MNIDTEGTVVISTLKTLERIEADTEDPDLVRITVEASSPEQGQVYMSSIELLTQAIRARARPAAEDMISSIVALCVPSKPVPSTLLREARMLVQAKTEVLQSNDWLTASEVSELAQFKSNNPSSQPNKWKLSNKIFALRHEGVDYFPIYGLDPNQGFRPAAGLDRVISTLSTMKDGWAMAFWFASPNSFLGGKLPKDCLKADPQRVLAAAEDEVAGVIHG